MARTKIITEKGAAILSNVKDEFNSSYKKLGGISQTSASTARLAVLEYKNNEEKKYQNAYIAHLETSNDELIDENAHLKITLDKKNAEIARLQDALVKKDAEIVELKDTLLENHTQLEMVKTERDSLNEFTKQSSSNLIQAVEFLPPGPT